MPRSSALRDSSALRLLASLLLIACGLANNNGPRALQNLPEVLSCNDSTIAGLGFVRVMLDASASGVPALAQPVPAACEMSLLGGGWTVLWRTLACSWRYTKRVVCSARGE